MNPLTYFREAKITRRPIAALTAYDYPTARLLDECELDILLVGDSLGMMVLGHRDTTEVTLDDMLHHTRAVARGVKDTLVVADMPAGTYGDERSAGTSASALIEAGAGAVKLEGGSTVAHVIRSLTERGIPVLGHIGMLPQQVKEEGGYHVKGRTEDQAEVLVADALAVEAAGAFAVVLELVTPPLASRITAQLAIPTIGIGSGDGCDGQIRVLHDVIGLFPWFRPRFAEPKADVAAMIQAAARAFRDDVGMAGEGTIPD